ncbi:FliH/SctL family protein [Limnohabitans sp. Rim8]|uniref:FliH/SctL family protein n=1 Tax=Limnohabitans sp. Rim8 TaxID=1100718 RepID=UPI00263424D5|nr:FliH/SctL family protein [Limnohabitans sp. Rim8]
MSDERAQHTALTGDKPKPHWRPLESLRPSMVKQVFSREQLTHKKGLLFTPDLHAEVIDLSAKTAPDAPEPSEAEASASEPADEHASAWAEAAPTPLTPEEIHEQAFAEGLAQGLAQGLEQGQAQALQAQAQREQEAATAQSTAQTLDLLEQIDQQVASLVEDPAQLQAPLKRLALHLAEQLVLGELTISPQSIERLIDRCLDTLDVPDASALVVELNPNDMALLQNQQRPEGQAPPAWRMHADSTLLPGSVRVRGDDALVNDLIENRLESLAQSLLNDNQQWQPQSAFAPSRLASRLASQRGSAQTIEDAPSRAAPLQPEARVDFQNPVDYAASAFDPVEVDAEEAEEAEEAEDPTQYTYEAHEVMRPARPPLAPPSLTPAPSPVYTPASAEVISQHFADKLSEIQLDLDKLDG